jgi:hypothetical protein
MEPLNLLATQEGGPQEKRKVIRLITIQDHLIERGDENHVT